MGTVSVLVLLVGPLLLIFGGLLGHAITQRLLERQIREQAETRRVVGEQWRAIQRHRARPERYRCTRCGDASHEGLVTASAGNGRGG